MEAHTLSFFTLHPKLYPELISESHCFCPCLTFPGFSSSLIFPLGSALDTFGQIFLTICCSILSSVKCTGKKCSSAAVVRLHLTLSGGLGAMGKKLWKQAVVKSSSFQLPIFKDFVTALTG